MPAAIKAPFLNPLCQDVFVSVRLSFVLISLVALLTGCAVAPQLPVAVSPQVLATPGTRIGVVMTALPKVDTEFPGAYCLLCMAAASATNSTLTGYTRTLPYEDLPQLKNQLAEVLKKRGAAVTMIEKIDFDALPDYAPATPNFARKNFTALKAKYNVDKIVVIALSNVGIERLYSAYIPTADPKARVSGVSYLVNLDTNALEWYLPLNVQKASDGKWDEPAKFPGLTNAYFQVLEMTKDEVIKPFLN
jgi:hypothetical protein